MAPILVTECLCVLDSTHLPITKEGGIADAIRTWLESSPESMRVGTFSKEGFYPVVTRKFVDRLGYMFHPLAYGRIDAEDWLLSVASSLGTLSTIDNCTLIRSKADGIEIIGDVDEDDAKWVGETLAQTLDEEVGRLETYLVK